MILQAIERQAIHGIKISPRALTISHLFFADDSIIFTRATVEEGKEILEILKAYEQASGQRINYDKSELSFSQNVLSSRIYLLEEVLAVKAVERHDRYLGLPTLLGRSKTQMFDYVRERVWKKLKGWKERFLSRAGKEILINLWHKQYRHM